jgi:hypothetical protein
MSCGLVMEEAMAKTRTVAGELSRRKNCRYGLRGVRVTLAGRGDELFTVRSTHWNALGKLVLTVRPVWEEPPLPKAVRYEILTGTELLRRAALEREEGLVAGEIEVDAAGVRLASDWPIVCRCWCDDGD